MPYTGVLMNDAQVDALDGVYNKIVPVNRWHQNIVGDVQDPNNPSVGAYCNDPGYGKRANAEFTIVDDNRVMVTALANNIKAGAEITVKYGEDYWRDQPRNVRVAYFGANKESELYYESISHLVGKPHYRSLQKGNFVVLSEKEGIVIKRFATDSKWKAALDFFKHEDRKNPHILDYLTIEYGGMQTRYLGDDWITLYDYTHRHKNEAKKIRNVFRVLFLVDRAFRSLKRFYGDLANTSNIMLQMAKDFVPKNICLIEGGGEIYDTDTEQNRLTLWQTVLLSEASVNKIPSYFWSLKEVKKKVDAEQMVKRRERDLREKAAARARPVPSLMPPPHLPKTPQIYPSLKSLADRATEERLRSNPPQQQQQRPKPMSPQKQSLASAITKYVELSNKPPSRRTAAERKELGRTEGIMASAIKHCEQTTYDHDMSHQQFITLARRALRFMK